MFMKKSKLWFSLHSNWYCWGDQLTFTLWNHHHLCFGWHTCFYQINCPMENNSAYQLLITLRLNLKKFNWCKITSDNAKRSSLLVAFEPHSIDLWPSLSAPKGLDQRCLIDLFCSILSPERTEDGWSIEKCQIWLKLWSLGIIVLFSINIGWLSS